MIEYRDDDEDRVNGKHINLRSIIRNRHLHLLKYEYLARGYVHITR